MPTATWNGEIIADSSDTIMIEGNHYFPAAAIRPGILRPSPTTSHCPWKGTAHYHSIEVAGATNKDAAWYYPDPSEKAIAIKGRIAFWKGVTVAP